MRRPKLDELILQMPIVINHGATITPRIWSLGEALPGQVLQHSQRVRGHAGIRGPEPVSLISHPVRRMSLATNDEAVARAVHKGQEALVLNHIRTNNQ